MNRFYFLSFCILFSFQYCFSQDIILESFGPPFSAPVEIKNVGDDRLFVVEKGGIIKILNADGTVNSTPFLNISAIVNSVGSEQGLLGLAFHPDYPTNPNFYVNYTNLSGDTVISEYTVSDNPDIANTTGTILLTIPQPYINHNGGCLNFGPDGYLYIATGDGGDGGDPQNRAQNLNSLLGKLLRIDVDNGTPYGIPADNPFLLDGDDNTLPEIWAYGLRNPWKFSFDSQTNELFIADVGQNEYEEINAVNSTDSGNNYGWRCYEGDHNYNTSGCSPSSTMTFPVAEYSHNNSGNFKCSITGGYVYRGTQQPSLVGIYFFADYCSTEIGMLSNNAGTWSYTFTEPFSGGNWVTFGEDNNGELYIADRFNGNVHKITEDNLSVDEFDDETIKIFPNPAKSLINIDFSNQAGSIYNIKIYSINGKMVDSFDNVNSEIFQVSTKNMQNGFYIVEIINEIGEKQLNKIVIN